MFKRLCGYFSKFEKGLWITSVFLIVVSFCVFDRSNFLTLVASIIGVTSILLNAKGNPLGQLLMVIFSVVYGYISFTCAYYGEMATYLGMTMPMALFALVAWLRHPFMGNKSEVEVNHIGRGEVCFMFILAVIVSIVFYYILLYFNTANIYPSTLSVTTSFVAVYLTFRRSPYFSLAYAANDVVLIVLWVLVSITDLKYISVVVCFVAFLLNDVYAYVSWKRMELRQRDLQDISS